MVIELPKHEITSPVADSAQDQDFQFSSQKFSARKRKRDLKAHRLRTEQLKYLKGYEDQILRLAIALNESPSEPSNNESSLSETETSIPAFFEHKADALCLEQVEIHQPQQIAEQGMASLIEASIKTGDVIALFQDISNRINLFALKSALEASRSGEAKGSFMQMAVELKDLAQETSEASCKLYSYMSSIQKTLSNTTHHMLDQYDDLEQQEAPSSLMGLDYYSSHGHDHTLTQAGLSWKKISERIAENVTSEDLAHNRSENMDEAEQTQTVSVLQDCIDHTSDSIAGTTVITAPVHERSCHDLGVLSEQLTQSLNAIRIRRKI